jgi:hypothetical protein
MESQTSCKGNEKMYIIVNHQADNTPQLVRTCIGCSTGHTAGETRHTATRTRNIAPVTGTARGSRF